MIRNECASGEQPKENLMQHWTVCKNTQQSQARLLPRRCQNRKTVKPLPIGSIVQRKCHDIRIEIVGRQPRNEGRNLVPALIEVHHIHHRPKFVADLREVIQGRSSICSRPSNSSGKEYVEIILFSALKRAATKAASGESCVGRIPLIDNSAHTPFSK
jgi:hypothetical protein